jgi:hypothetical protein
VGEAGKLSEQRHELVLPLVKWLITFCILVAAAFGQAWSGILPAGTAIDWSGAGTGGIPTRPILCLTLNPVGGDMTATIQAALNACAPGEALFLSAGTFRVNGNLTIPANVTLRGTGASQTVIDAHATSGAVINLGTGGTGGGPGSSFVAISSGSTQGSSSLVVSSATGFVAGKYMMIDELNDPAFVTIQSAESPGGPGCTFCDDYYSGTRSRGQIVQITSVVGTTIGFTPALYSDFTHTPHATVFTATSNAGVENLQVFANNTGVEVNFLMNECAFCWIKGVESNYADGDHVTDQWGFHDEIRDSYFSNAFLHTSGTHDSDLGLLFKTTATLVENNIFDRLHLSILLERGPAGNVVGYNYMTGNFDSGSTNVVMGEESMHGSHPQWNLFEGNVANQYYPDAVWGSASQNTGFRNWYLGTGLACTPTSGRGTVNCSGANGHTTYQAARAEQIAAFSTTFNLVGEVVGSAQMAALLLNGTGPGAMPQTAQLTWNATRAYDTRAYGLTWGYGNESDDGTNVVDSTNPFTTSFIHGFYNFVDGSTTWSGVITHTLPASFYLPSQPSWWPSAVAYPSIGPDITGGTGPGGHVANALAANPAQYCYTAIMGGSDGGAGSPLLFDASVCYPTNVSVAGGYGEDGYGTGPYGGIIPNWTIGGSGQAGQFTIGQP